LGIDSAAVEGSSVTGKVEGKIQAIDASGNLVTDITRAMLDAAPRNETVVIHCDGHETNGIFDDAATQPPMTFVATFGQSGNLELAIVGDSAAAMFGVQVGEKVSVRW
jgi:S-adenosyl-L-methionine hydrolase (adenosine-forming)